MLDLTASPKSDPLRAYRYRDGIYAGDLILTAIVHLDLFTWLGANPSTKQAIQDHYQFAERPLDVLLTLCAANGFIALQNGIYQITASAREHLSNGSPWNLTPYYASLKDRPIAKDFLEVLRTDKPAVWGSGPEKLDWHRAMETEEFSRSFTAAMDCRGIFLSQALAKRTDLSGYSRLLDIGGGSGIYACTFCAHYPNLEATVYEQSPVDRIAQRGIEERGYTGRVTVATGDLHKDELPTDCDVHLYSNVLHDWGLKEVRHLLALSFRTLKPGGTLIIHDAFINPGKNGPLAVAEYSAMLMHSTQGKCYSFGEYSELLSEAGFIPGTYRDTAADRGFMTGKKLG